MLNIFILNMLGFLPRINASFLNFRFFILILIIFSNLIFFYSLSRLFNKPIEIVTDRFGKLAFKVYQRGGSKFIVKGYNGYPKRVIFRRYTDVKSFIDNHTQVIS